MKRHWIFATAVAAAALTWAIAHVRTDAAPSETAKAGAGHVNVYSHRHYPIDKVLFRRFEERTGIKVFVIKANADELIKRLEREGAHSAADVLITVDAGRLYRAQSKGLLQKVTSDVLTANIPAQFRHPQGFWFGLTMRARVIVYSKERVEAKDLSTYEALTDAKWRGKVLVRSSANIYNQSLVASMIAHNGKEASAAWAGDMVAAMARRPKGKDRDQIKAVAAGIGDVALVNTYYLGLMLNSKIAADRASAEKVAIFFPNQDGRGTHINISGAGVTSSAKNRANAIRLLEFLSTAASQTAFANANHEYPVNPKAELSPLLKSWGEFKIDTVDLELLGRHNGAAVEIFDKARWR